MRSRRRGRRASWIEAAEMLHRRDAVDATCRALSLLAQAALQPNDPAINVIRDRLNLREADRHGADGRIRFRGQRASLPVVDDPEAN